YHFALLTYPCPLLLYLLSLHDALPISHHFPYLPFSLLSSFYFLLFLSHFFLFFFFSSLFLIFFFFFIFYLSFLIILYNIIDRNARFYLKYFYFFSITISKLLFSTKNFAVSLSTNRYGFSPSNTTFNFLIIVKF